MRLSALLLSCLAALSLSVRSGAADSDHATDGVLADRAVRYVNDSVLSVGDILVRMYDRQHELMRENGGKPQPFTVEFAQQALEDLTDEELLVQYGKQFANERKFRLVDVEELNRRIKSDQDRSGGSLTLRQQAELRRRYERQQILGIVLHSIFYPRAAHITEAEVASAYEARKAQYSRPARIQPLEILLRASDPKEREQVAMAQRQLFKNAQELDDAALRQLATKRLDAFFAATPIDQNRILGEFVAEVAAVERTDLDRASRELVAAAGVLTKRAAGLRDLAAAQRQLDDLRTTLAGTTVANLPGAFKDAAKRLSQGPNASEGGDLGWIEPGFYSAEFDRAAFTCATGTLSPVFVADNAACLIYMTAREEARTRPLDEVRGELQELLRRQREAEVKRNAIAMLRSKASIRDLVPLARVIE
jgi:parvulin-like peptidyl-prolyl isomerase